MELAMNNGFSELSFDEMEAVDGGKWYKRVIGVAAYAASVAVDCYCPLGPVTRQVRQGATNWIIYG